MTRYICAMAIVQAVSTVFLVVTTDTDEKINDTKSKSGSLDI